MLNFYKNSLKLTKVFKTFILLNLYNKKYIAHSLNFYYIYLAKMKHKHNIFKIFVNF